MHGLKSYVLIILTKFSNTKALCWGALGLQNYVDTDWSEVYAI